MDVSTQTFQTEVIEASHQKPVLVDFWAAWCGPCQYLGPVLEKLAMEQGERWTLAKVNTDQHPDLSATYKIRGIPAVKLFVAGKVVAEFTGALPATAIQQWLDQNLPTLAKKQLEEAKQAIARGELGEAIYLLEGAVLEEPQNTEAAILLAEQLVFADPQRAKSLAKGGAFAGMSFVQREEAIQTLVHWIEANPDDLPMGAGNAKHFFESALVALKHQDFGTTLTLLMEALQADRYYADDAARKLGIAVFTWLGDAHPLSLSLRRRFNMWLY